MPADLSAINFFAPIAAFLIVFIVTYAILVMTKILGDNKGVHLTMSFLIAAVFVSASGAVKLVQTIVPWFVVLLISLFFILFFIGFVGKDADFLKKGIGIAVLVIAGIIFLVSAFVVFSDTLQKYVPGPGYGAGADESTLFFTDWLYSPRVIGAVLLILISVVVSWVLISVGNGKKK
ncbi:hypothetical protein J4408_03625 [Candidatus Pacearchaeota archaeon]|nr:hypothetical protein [Candidatus Pacearchaeota archaeon]